MSISRTNRTALFAVLFICFMTGLAWASVPLYRLFCAATGLNGTTNRGLAAAILAISIVYYAVVYTIWLKPRTPQNIVIGGGAGAFPPLIGWAAATGDIALLPVLLFLFVFLWTPPHFWALALFMKSDYAAAGVPMLPVVSGERTTRTQIGLYTIPMAAVAILPWPLGLTGPIYGIAAVLLTSWFALLAVRVAKRTTHADDLMKPEKALFKYSILYLFVMFGALVVDRWFA